MDGYGIAIWGLEPRFPSPQSRVPTRIEHERHHRPGVHRVQTPELQHDEEQEEDERTARAEQVLPLLPEAHRSKRDEVSEALSHQLSAVSSGGRLTGLNADG